MSGTLVYVVEEGKGRLRSLRLTVCSDDDRQGGSLSMLRRKKLSRILMEASTQGARLSYRDLGMIMLVSRATLKRDLGHLRRSGFELPVSGAGKRTAER